MTPEQWHQVRQILEEVSAADPAARARTLGAACGADALVRETVERLLGRQQSMADFLERPLLANLPLPDPEQSIAETIGRRIGPYRIEREIGRGGMGVVYLAISEEDQQQVAIKLIWPGLDSNEVLRRFHQERMILAKLTHDHIARLLNAGTTEEGWPYLVLEYVDGLSITAYCDKNRLSLTDRLKLFQSVCAVVEHAHQNRVIHRDLKPSNILVTADGMVKLLDFGIAKLLEPDAQLGSSPLTRSLLPVMTPEYASPEQVRGQSITAATDVYSLGVVLYELLTGRRPFKFDHALLPEVIRVICEEEPERPSAAISQVEVETESTGTASAPEKLRRQLAGDLDNIVLMALRKEAQHRYQSVEQLSEDIGRYLEGKPVIAHKGALSYRAGKFIRRHRVSVISATVILLVLVTATVTAAWRARALKEQAQRDRRFLYASQMRQAAPDWDEGNLSRLQDTLNHFLPQSGEEDLRGFEWYYLWRLAHPDLRTLSYPAGVNAVAYSPDGKLLAVAFQNGTVRLVAAERELPILGRQDPSVPPLVVSPTGQSLAFSPDGSKLAAGILQGGFKLWNLATGQETIVAQGGGAITSIAFSPDGQRMVTGSSEGLTQLWSVATQQKLITLGEKTEYLHGVVFFPDGKKIAMAGEDRLIRLYDAASGKLLDTLKGHNGEVIALAVSPDGRFLASGGGDNVAMLWDVATRRRLRTFVGHQTEIRAIAFSPDGQTLATGSSDRTVKLWDLVTEPEIRTLKGHTGKIVTLAFSPDGKRLASGSDDRTVKLWDVTSNQEAEIIENPSGKLMSLAVSPDGRTAATGDNQGVTQLWELATGRKLETLMGHQRGQSVTSVVFSPDGQQLATAGHDRAVILWTSPADNHFVKLSHTVEHYGVFSPDRAIEVRSDGGPVTLLDVINGQELLTLKGHIGPVRSLVFSSDGKLIATGSEDRTAKLWDAVTGRELKTFTGHPDTINPVRLTPDGKTLIADNRRATKVWDIARRRERYIIKGDIELSPDGKRLVALPDGQAVKIHDATTGRELLTINEPANDVLTATFSFNGQHLATGRRDGIVTLWDAATGRKLGIFPGHTGSIYGAAFSPDSQSLATASTDHTVKLWDVTARREIRTFKGHTAGVDSVVFSPDGAKLLTSGYDGAVKLWDVATGQAIVSRSVFGISDSSFSAAFSPDGRILAAGSRTIAVLDVAARRGIATCEGHTDDVHSICFSPDSQRLASGSVDTTARVWDAATGRELLNLKGHQSNVWSVAFSPDGKLLATGSSDHTAKLWDAATGRHISTLSGHADEVLSVAFSPDGKRLVTGSSDHTIKIWDVETGQELATLKGHTEQVTSIAFAPDGKTLVSVSRDRTMRIWRAATDDAVQAHQRK